MVGPVFGSSAADHPFDAAAFQANPIDLQARGTGENEYFLSGIANVYQFEDNSSPANNAVTVLRHGAYTNRILVRKPVDPARFSGNVIVELLNATNNYDLPVFWSYDHDQFLSRGDIWIGITSKPVSIAGLKKLIRRATPPCRGPTPIPTRAPPPARCCTASSDARPRRPRTGCSGTC